MSDVSFLRRGKPAVTKVQQPEVEPEVFDTDMFSQLALGLKSQMHNLKRKLEQTEIDRDRERDSREFAAQENVRIGRERDGYKAQYNELRIGVEAICMSAISACQLAAEASRTATATAEKACNDVADRCRELLDAVRDAGPKHEPSPQIEPDFQAEIIGKAFGANNRKED